MKVLILLRCDAFTKFGGDTFQAQKYRAELIKLRVDAELIAGVPEDLSDCDLVHVFNLDRVIEPYLQAQHARQAGKPVILSAVHHPDSWVEFFRWNHAPLVVRAFEWLLARNKCGEVAKDLVRCLTGAAPWAGWWEELAVAPDELQRKLLRNCDAVTLLANAEAAWITRDCGIAPPNALLVPNAVDVNLSSEEPPSELTGFCEAHPQFVLVCGRIEPRKNQRSILAALGEKYPIVFAGGLNPRARDYGSAFLRELKNTKAGIYAGQLPPAQLAWLYRRAHAHVLFSWFEASPLVDVEAWAAGCHVVTTTRSYASEYAGDVFNFVEPSRPQMLLNAVDRVMSSPRRTSADECRLSGLQHGWAAAAVKLAALYGRVLTEKRHHPQNVWTLAVI